MKPDLLVLLITFSLRMVPEIFQKNILLVVGILNANILESNYTIAWYYLNEKYITFQCLIN